MLVLATDRGRHSLDPLVRRGCAAHAAGVYHEGSRTLQDLFDSRRIADRLVEITVHERLTDADVAFIEGAGSFFLATADADGWPDVSYKGGRPGFVRCLDPATVAFPSYDGNGMFRSLGNVIVNERVGMLFIDMVEPKRLRIQGRATIDLGDPLLHTWDGAQLVVRVEVERAFPNCPRYIHPVAGTELSVYAPAPGHEPPVPEWKRMEVFRDHLPADT